MGTSGLQHLGQLGRCPTVNGQFSEFALDRIFAKALWLALAWAFLPDEPGLRRGLVLVGLVRCIAMVSTAPY